MEINNWNGNNFPHKLSLTREGTHYKLELSKYLLDNLYGDVNLEDAPITILLTYRDKTEEDCLKFAEQHIPELMNI